METSDPKYKHKPSEKHTLEEVLKSLQDLIRNDLAEGASGTANPAPAPAGSRQREDTAPGSMEVKPRHETATVLREDFSPVSPGSGPVNLDAVMRSLKDLIGNELNVGDEPKPPETRSAATHEEYLAAAEKIEEYIPEELGQLGDELNIGAEPVVDKNESTRAQNELSAPEEIVAESLPEGFVPLDEGLTLEELAEAAPLPPAVSEPDLAEVLSSELPGEPAPTPPPDKSPAPEEIVAQSPPDELMPFEETLTLEELAEALEAAPPPPATSEAPEPPDAISLEPDQGASEPSPEEFTPLEAALAVEQPLEPGPPPAALTETAELPGEISPELLQEPESPPPAPVATPPAPAEDLAPGTQREMFFEEPPPRASEPGAVTTDSAPATATEPVPTPEPQTPADKHEQPVEVKQEHIAEALPTIEVEESFDDTNDLAANPSSETLAPISEETIILDAEISPEPKIVASTDTEAAAPPAESSGKKITLEIASEPVQEKPRDKYSVDFDLSNLTPPLPDESELSPPETGPTAQSEAPVTIDSAPAPVSKTVTPPPEPPVVEAKTDTPAETKPPQQVTETATPEPPASNNLDDIPVLSEVVAPPSGGVLTAKPTAPPSTPLPAPPDRAREVVVRAVAKLNVEMRKSGGAGLDTKTILRLQQLIRQELEKSGEK